MHCIVRTKLLLLQVARGLHEKAVKPLREALRIEQHVLGSDHRCKRQLEHSYSLFFDTAPSWDASESHFKCKYLILYSLGHNYTPTGCLHREVASTVTSLAAVLHHMGKLGEAHILYRRALAIRESTQGEGHPDSAIALSNLAALLQMTGELSEADTLYRRSLRILESQNGSQKAS